MLMNTIIRQLSLAAAPLGLLGVFQILLLFGWLTLRLLRGGEPLPLYQLELSGSAACRLCTEAAPPIPHNVLRVFRNTPLSVLLRPQHSVRRPVHARAYYVQGSKAAACPAPLTQTDQSAFMLQGTAGQLAPETEGECELVFLVGSGALPLPYEEALATVNRRQKSGRWQILRQRLVIQSN